LQLRALQQLDQLVAVDLAPGDDLVAIFSMPVRFCRTKLCAVT